MATYRPGDRVLSRKVLFDYCVESGRISQVLGDAHDTLVHSNSRGETANACPGARRHSPKCLRSGGTGSVITVFRLPRRKLTVITDPVPLALEVPSAYFDGDWGVA